MYMQNSDRFSVLCCCWSWLVVTRGKSIQAPLKIHERNRGFHVYPAFSNFISPLSIPLTDPKLYNAETLDLLLQDYRGRSKARKRLAMCGRYALGLSVSISLHVK